MRTVFLLLLAANLAFLGWSQGWLKAWGWAPQDPAEPQRLAQQVKPEALRLLRPSEVPPPEPPPGPAVCLQAPLTSLAQAAAVKEALGQRLQPDQWLVEAKHRDARWIVYMGRFDTADALARKRQELVARAVAMEPLRNEALAPGLSLGGYPTQAAANEALTKLTQRGVRTARVVQELTEQDNPWLRLPALSAATRDELAPLWGTLGIKPQACSAADAAAPQTPR